MATALYQQIYNDLMKAINSHAYDGGKRLPTELELAQSYGVSRITSRKALTLLGKDKVIIRHSGIGSVVNPEHFRNAPEDDAPPQEGLALGRSIGLIVEALWSCYGVGIFEGATARAEEQGYNLVLKTSRGDQAKEIEAIDALLAMGADGILISPVHGGYYNERILKLILKGYPIVFVDRYLSGIAAPHVGTDNAGAAETAVDYLVEKGHREIAFFTTGRGQATTLEEREKGFLSGLIKNGISPRPDRLLHQLECVSPLGWQQSLPGTLRQIEQYLAGSPQVTAVLSCEYGIAEMLRHAVGKSGRKLDIICFDSPKSDVGDYVFTHLEQDEQEIGRAAADMLLRLTAKEPVEASHVLLPAKLVRGQSA